MKPQLDTRPRGTTALVSRDVDYDGIGWIAEGAELTVNLLLTNSAGTFVQATISPNTLESRELIGTYVSLPLSAVEL